MASGATSLNLVRDELFATMEEAESSLEHFIADRQNGSLLQQAVESLKQVRGTLSLIELVGAELLAQEVLDQATDIPAGAGEERDVQLAALSNALHVLRRYLEGLRALRFEIPELLLPAINDLRQAGGQPVLPESFFFSVRLDHPRPRHEAKHLEPQARAVLTRRLRHMYQVGLLGFIREEGSQASLRLMERALARLDGLYTEEPSSRLFWIGSAALEAQADGQMLARKSRKQLFAKLDRELKQVMANAQYEPPKNLLKELLYLIALTDTPGAKATALRETFGLANLPFTDHMLEEEYQRLSGPGHEVMRSLSSAIREELASVKDMLDLAERGTLQAESVGILHTVLSKLSKTLGMVGLNSAANVLTQQLVLVHQWVEGQPISMPELNKLAEAVLYVESAVATLEQGEVQEVEAPSAQQQSDSFAEHQLSEARIVVVDEAQAGLAMAKRSITGYLESNGDKLHLANVPFSLQSVRGGLWFLDQPRAAQLVGACSEYITLHMLEAQQMPSEHMLETLADALTSLEYYLEAGAVLRPETKPSVLDLAAESVAALGMQVA